MRSLRVLAALALLGWSVAPSPPSASAASPAESAVTLPDTPPGRRLGELLRVVNAGDRAALAEYAKTGFAPNMLQPDDSILDFLHGQYRTSGGFELRRVLQSADAQITALVQGRSKRNTWLRYVVGTETSPPHRITGVFAFHASEALAAGDSGPLAHDELPARLESLVDRIAAEGNFSGSVCLARRGKVLVNRAWGEADRGSHARNTPATRFGIASVGKLFTAVGIAMLVESGRLAFEDTVARRIPDWLPPGAGAVTVEHLLTHTSGLGDYLPQLVDDRSGRRYDRLEDYRRLAISSRPPDSPGAEFRYSNTGYLLLGALLEKTTGRPWDAWLRDSVFTPARMSHTTAMRPARPDPGIATGYHREDGGAWVGTDTLLAGRGTPAGGGVSTAEDLARFAAALAEGRLVSKPMLERMRTPRVSMAGTGKRYGYGLEVASGRDGWLVYGHEGGFPGVGALVELHEPDGYVLAVLSNTTGGAAPIGDVWRDLLARARAGGAGR
jgi:CubicO group peptidase (beta-lactamase class C family)